jgi:DNA-binding transcriptional regulator YiaG
MRGRNSAKTSDLLRQGCLVHLRRYRMQIPSMRMDKDQYRAALRNLGMSQHTAAGLFGVTGKTSHNWALGKTRIPGSVALLLRYCVKRGLKPWDVL